MKYMPEGLGGGNNDGSSVSGGNSDGCDDNYALYCFG